MILIALSWTMRTMSVPRLYILNFFILFSSSHLLGQDPFDAAKKGDLAAVKISLERDAQLVFTKDDRENTLLHYAAAGGFREVAEALLAAGAAIDAPGRLGRTPVLMASMNGRTATVDFLIAKGADLFIRDANGSTPLSVAISGGNRSLIESIVRQSLLGNTDETNRRSVLHQVAAGGLELIVEKMISRGVDISSTNDDGGTLLHSAVRGGLVGTTGILLEKGFQVNARDNLGRTPLHYALLTNNQAFVITMIDRGADVNLPDADGRTPLQIAEDWGNPDNVNLLLNAGAKRTERKIYRLEKKRGSLSQQPVEITCLGNCGFMVVLGKKKILFDVEGLKQSFFKPSIEIAYDLMKVSRPPFDGIDFVFISHADSDEIGFREVTSLMQAQSGIKVISATDTKEEMRKVDSAAFKTLASRVETVDPAYGKAMNRSLEGIETEILGLCHSGAPGSMLKDLGFVVNLDGVKVFFLGNIDPSLDLNAAAFREWGKRKEEIDILTTASPILYDPAGVTLVKETIRPKYVIAMHVAPAVLQSEQAKCKRNFPQTMFFREIMERKLFR